MTPKERVVMQQALEALEEAYSAQFETTWFEIKPEHFTALREALAEQAEQEPVAWYLDTFDEYGELEDREYNGTNKFSCGRGNGTPLYATPVRTKDLTDDEIWGVLHDKGLMEGIRSVIAADREKNK